MAAITDGYYGKILTAQERVTLTTPVPGSPDRGFRAQVVVGGLLIDGSILIRHRQLPALIAFAKAALAENEPDAVARFRELAHGTMALEGIAIEGQDADEIIAYIDRLKGK